MQDTALNQALGQLRPTLLKIARLQLRNDTWAEDVVSETLIAALEGAQDFAGTSQLKTWVIGILKHKIIDQFRRTSREVSVEAAVEADPALIRPVEIPTLVGDAGRLRSLGWLPKRHVRDALRDVLREHGTI